MVATAEFEEKDFEAPLYRQLLDRSKLIATPGQVFEGKFGIDAAMNASNPLFWEIVGYRKEPKGAVLNDYQWGHVWRRGVAKKKLPTFSINLLVQAKRPEILKGRNARLSPFGITGGYWRFFLRPHQQQILEKVQSTLGNRALLVYACPAFSSFDALYAHTESETIISNSTFVKVDRLRDHVAWNYNEPGTTGVANAEPTLIRDRPFIEQIEILAVEGEEDDPVAALTTLFKGAMISCEELASENGLARYYLRIIEALRSRIEQSELDMTITLPFIGFYLFSTLLSISWLCVAAKQEPNK